LTLGLSGAKHSQRLLQGAFLPADGNIELVPAGPHRGEVRW
jgi:hypothetical protein